MTDSIRRLKLRSALDRGFYVIALACIVTAGVGGWIAYETHVQPGTETIEETEVDWSETARFDHSAEVTRDNPVFSTGTSLAGPTYYTSIAPILDVEYRYGIDAPEGSSVTVETDSELLIRSVGEQGEFWRDTESLGTTSSEITPAETATVNFEANVSAAEQRIGEIESGIGASVGSPEVSFIVRTTVTGTVDGEPVTEGYRHELPVSPSGSTYEVEDPGSITETHESVRTSEVERTYGPVRTIGSPLVVVLSFAGLSAIALARHRDLLAVSDAEWQQGEANHAREEFDDWISSVRIPAEKLDGTGIETASLEDLVDIAIDTDRRVLEDPERQLFYVEDGSSHYTFTPTYWPTDVDDVPADDSGEPDADAGSDTPVDDPDMSSPDPSDGSSGVLGALFGSDGDGDDTGDGDGDTATQTDSGN